ncbi:hypothetical protein PAECIP112173_03385 [Paenibacillus sp. JJ-100]|uniref:DUF3238 domain-containing protein n=1 Tax=Paenibacillus sp. JJ-100 TaxID=2974896 RepID=UPI0022FF7CD8|nr:DUF3238 domain-containing protein [Paenibacillus sp. JJ-100]CAI6081965.1 hypothetical protein PAECIP112173_03385 [Paenibacillus sp. JJ-100]
MANTIEVRFAAFIPQAWIEYMRTSKVIIQYNGNNRDFTYNTENQPELSKMVQHIVVDFTNKEIKYFKSTGSTTERTIEISSGKVLRQAYGHAPDTGLTISNKVITSSSASFSLRASAANPLNSDAPPIDWEYSVTVTSQGKVTVKGRHDGYPAHEIYKRVDKGTPIRMYSHDPRVTGDTPLSLFSPMEKEVNKTV